jgi:hypothetical protein
MKERPVVGGEVRATHDHSLYTDHAFHVHRLRSSRPGGSRGHDAGVTSRAP